MTSKNCNKCNKLKPLSDFYRDNVGQRDYVACCKKCINAYSKLSKKKYKKTKNGLLACIYNNQTGSSKQRGITPPNYMLNEFRNWALSKALFHDLYDNWVESGYDKYLTPSFDRINDYSGYSLNNIQLMTWAGNEKKGNEDRKNGENNKQSRVVIQSNLDGSFIKQHYSLSSAGKITGTGSGNIWSCCNGMAKTAGGFKWRYL